MDTDISDTDALLQRLDTEFTRTRTVIYVFLTAVMTSGLLGNFLVIVVYVTKFKATATRTFIVTLAVLDLIGCLQGIPLEFVNVARVYTYPSSVLCKWYASVNAFTSLASVLVLLVVAVDRYRRICLPLMAQMTLHNARQASLCCSLVAIFLTWPFAVLWGGAIQHTGIANVTGTKCYVDESFRGTPYPFVYSSILFLLFAGSVVVLVALYALIYGQIRRQLRLHGGPLGPELRASPAAVVPADCGAASRETTDEVTRSTRADAPDQAAGADCLQTASSSGCQETMSSESEEAPVSGSSGDADESSPFHPEDRARTSALTTLKRIFFSKSNSIDIQACEDKAQGVNVHAPWNAHSTGELTAQGSDSEFTNADCQDSAADTSNNAQEIFNDQQSAPSGQPERSTQFPLGTLARPEYGERNQKVKRRAEAVRKTTLTLFLVTLIYVLSYLPCLVVMTLRALQSNLVQGGQGPSAIVYELLARFVYLQNAANPFIYGFRNSDFRSKFRQLLSCRR